MRGRNEYPSVGTWEYITIEGYCMLNMDYGMRKDRYLFKLRRDGSWKRIRNTMYDPAAEPDSYPEGCARGVSSRCIGCRHFAWCDAHEGPS